MGNTKSYFTTFSQWIGLSHEPFRVLIMGLDAAGKTTILYRLKIGEIVTTIPTIGFNVETINNKNVNITMWDLGGRDKMRPLFRHYFSNTQAVIYVLDSNDKERIEEASNEMHSILAEDELRDCVVLILANKQDLENCLSVEQIKTQIKYDQIKHSKKNIIGCVATSGEGLNEGIDWLTSTLYYKDNQLVSPIRETLDDAKQIASGVNESWLSYLYKLSAKFKNITN